MQEEERSSQHVSRIQFSEGLLTESITSTSTGPFELSSLRPSCSSNAVNNEGPLESAPGSPAVVRFCTGANFRTKSYVSLRLVLSMIGRPAGPESMFASREIVIPLPLISVPAAVVLDLEEPALNPPGPGWPSTVRVSLVPLLVTVSVNTGCSRVSR